MNTKGALTAGMTALAVLLTAQSLGAQSILPDTVVSATRIPRPAEQVGGSVTVIDEEELSRKQRRTLTDALQDVPGTRIVQLGGPGRQASLFVRGANSNQVLVLIDGIEIGDPSAPAGAYDFGNFFLGDVGRIEVLRGAPASTYGSDAIGGVVNIVSAPALADSASIEAEGGSFETFNQSLRAARVSGSWRLSGGVGHAKSHGEPLTASRFTPANGTEEDDGYENYTGSLILEGEPAENLEMRFVVHAFQTDAENDPTAQDPDASSQTKQYYARLQLSSDLRQGQWVPTLGLNVTHIRRAFSNFPDPLANTFQLAQNTGRRLKVDWRNDLYFLPDHQLSVGFEYEHEKFENTQFANFSGFVISGQSGETVAARTIYVQDTYTLNERAFVTADVRYDDDTRFAGKATYRVSPVFLVTGDVKLRGAYGTGFRTPALFELFGNTNSFNGNRNLVPEKSVNWEIGIDKTFSRGSTVAGLTYFDSRIKNIIVSSGNPSTPNNVREADINGVEAIASTWLRPNVRLQAGYTFTAAENATTGQVFQRRPKHQADVDLFWQATPNVNLTALLNYVGETRDAGFNGGTVYRGGYTVANLRGAWQAADRITAFARIDNVFDNEHEVADGFRGPGRGLYVGAAVRF